MNSHWRDTMRPHRFWIFDGNTVLLFLFLIFVPVLFIQKIMLGIIVVTIVFLRIAESKGLTVSRAIKWIRCALYGKSRKAWPSTQDRRSIDHNKLCVYALVFLACAALTPTKAKAEFKYIAPDLLASAPIMTVSGLPLSEAIHQIIPPGFEIHIGPGVNQSEKIEWRSKAPWPHALKAALNSVDLQYERDGTQIYISKAPDKTRILKNWSVKKGQKLSDVLTIWGKAADVRVQFLTDRDWPIETSHSFNGNFEQATLGLLTALSDSSPAPVGELTNRRKLLLILNR